MVTSSAPRPGGLRAGTLLAALVGVASAGLVLLILGQFLFQALHPQRTTPFTFVKQVPLPSALPTQFVANARDLPKQGTETPLTPGVSLPGDAFDFQALDPVTKLLFFAHPGPAPDAYAQFDRAFDIDKDEPLDGYVGVIDTKTNTLVGRVNVPQIAGLVAAPDLGLVFAADGTDGVVYSIDEHTLKATQIDLGSANPGNDSPDAIEYDQDDHKVFVSDPGQPSDPPPHTPPGHPFLNIPLDNQAVVVIDPLHNNAVIRINLGHQSPLPTEDRALSPFGYDVGHNHYDSTLHRDFVITQQLTDQSVLNPDDPPGGTGELEAIDPATDKIVARLQLPNTCGIPHGMNIDQQEQIAFIACTLVAPDQTPTLIEHLTRVNLRTFTNIPDPLSQTLLATGPDIVIMDSPLHLVFVGCAGGVSVFDDSNNQLHRIGSFIIGKGDTHTIFVDPTTQDVYSPETDVGGRPEMVIFHFDLTGVVLPKN
jgi:hypothetical protein